MSHTTREERLKVYAAALETFGPEVQLIVALEEMGELQKELCKALRGFVHPANVAEELADAGIMLEQIRYIFRDGAPDLYPYDLDIIKVIRQTAAVQLEVCKVLLQQAPPDQLVLETEDATEQLKYTALAFSVGPFVDNMTGQKISRLRQRIEDAKE